MATGTATATAAERAAAEATTERRMPRAADVGPAGPYRSSSLQQGSRFPGAGRAAWTPRATARVRHSAAACASTSASRERIGGRRARAGRDREDEVAVERRVRRDRSPAPARRAPPRRGAAAPALSSAASVATIASVVFAAGPPGPGFIGRGVKGGDRPRGGSTPPNSSPISKIPAQKARLPGDQHAAEGVDRHQRADRRAVLGDERGRAEPAHQRRRHRAGPGPDASRASKSARRRVEGRRAERRGRGSPSQALSPPLARSKRIAAGTIGTRGTPGRPDPKPRPARVQPVDDAARRRRARRPSRPRARSRRPRRPAGRAPAGRSRASPARRRGRRPGDERPVGDQHRHPGLQPRRRSRCRRGGPRRR